MRPIFLVAIILFSYFCIGQAIAEDTKSDVRRPSGRAQLEKLRDQYAERFNEYHGALSQLGDKYNKNPGGWVSPEDQVRTHNLSELMDKFESRIYDLDVRIAESDIEDERLAKFQKRIDQVERRLEEYGRRLEEFKGKLGTDKKQLMK